MSFETISAASKWPEQVNVKNILGAYPITLLFFIFCLFGFAHAENTQKEKSIMTHDSLGQRGKQLRAAIEQTYKELVDAKALNPRGGNDITEIVVRYIPVGMTFDDAEQILRNAGFKVEPRPSANPPGSLPWRYDVIGIIDSFDSKRFLSNVRVWVHLIPQAPGDYDKVSKVSASVTLSSL